MRGVLRVHFTAEDLARTRVAPAPDPMWELVMSVHKLRTTTGGLAYRAWRGQALPALATPRKRTGEPLLRQLVPRRGDFPDFITPVESVDGFEHGLDAVLRTPRARLLREVEFLARQRRLPGWMADLALGRPAVLDDVASSLRSYHDRVIEPFWDVVRAHTDADRALRARAFLDGGVEGVLDSLRPALRWNSPVLEAEYPVDWDVPLEGRGVLLIPSYFCWNNPVTLIDKSIPVPVLVYPVDHDLTMTSANGPFAAMPADRRLGALLGHTRGRVLVTLADMHTTGELARRLGLSPAAVSQHTTVLRDAGLVTTRRDANRSLHVISPLGRALMSTATGT
ncbi:ArsR/SmtB family transcription factor [Saccharothrix sp. Mg75]|uniref:ArsR/SmtB family transcription factor n=1 Tax=Saccharothrix sp. Mg75 TaxID=3445357 RepID=UPI003EE8331D